MEKAREILAKVFGYEQFRQGQEQAVSAILRGQDVMAVMPTGAGKSICYQVPALCMDGITLVVSPLISLMRDQVGALLQCGVRAAFLNSSLSYAQYKKALANAREGMYKIIYVAPERLLTPDFLDFAQAAPIDLLTVDEAHCVSQWGQDFRPGYLSIKAFVDTLPRRPRVAAFTATATSQVSTDIVELLDLRMPEQIWTGFDRENLHFEVRYAQCRDRHAELFKLLDEMPGQNGIIYCATRKGVEDTHHRLLAEGYRAARYHAGLEAHERKEAQEVFLRDEVDMIVATNAFGMGIDKSNVQYVIHMNMPRDMESYYQEAGRAGRDGMYARCILLYHPQDIMLAKYFIEHSSDENEEMDEAQRALLQKRAQSRLQAMTKYISCSGCLRQSILSYFGQAHEGDCGNCSVCEGDIPEERRPGALSRVLTRGKKKAAQYGLTSAEMQLFERLADLRKRLARTRSVPAFVIFSDATLRDMAKKHPRTNAQMLRVSGVGEQKLKSFGEAFIKEIAAFDRMKGGQNE